MARTLQILGASYVESLLLARYAPQYSLGTFITAFLLFFLQFSAYIFYSIVIYPRFFSPLRHLPEAPDGTFFLGQTKRIIREASGVPMREWVEHVPNNGLIRYSMWFQERLLVTTPAALSEVLVTKNYDFIKPPQVRNGLGRILGIGILLAEGEEHKIQRKNLMPAFAFRHIKNIYPVFWSKGKEMIECLANASKTGESTSEHHISDTDNHTSETKHEPGAIDVGNWSSRATLDIIGLSGMGQDFDSLHDPTNKLSKTYQDVFNPGPTGRLLQLAGLFIPFWLLRRLPLKRNHEINGAAEYIKQVCRDMITKKQAALKHNPEEKENGTDILSIALSSGGFAPEDLVNQMMTFLVAGHETTATAMIWALYTLCKNPSIQTKLRQEIRSKIPSPNSGTPITASDIDDCHYLQACVSEILRLWAPVALTLRIAAKDTSIAGEPIPKGTMIILSPWATNTSRHLWGADAMAFRPERWLNPDGKANAKGSAESNYSFLTFLHGPRSCIGQRFAVAEFACLLACWVGRFDTRFEKGSKLGEEGMPEIKGGVTSKPKGGLWCKTEEVEGW